MDVAVGNGDVLTTEHIDPGSARIVWNRISVLIGKVFCSRGAAIGISELKVGNLDVMGLCTIWGVTNRSDADQTAAWCALRIEIMVIRSGHGIIAINYRQVSGRRIGNANDSYRLGSCASS